MVYWFSRFVSSAHLHDIDMGTPAAAVKDSALMAVDIHWVGQS